MLRVVALLLLATAVCATSSTPKEVSSPPSLLDVPQEASSSHRHMRTQDGHHGPGDGDHPEDYKKGDGGAYTGVESYTQHKFYDVLKSSTAASDWIDLTNKATQSTASGNDDLPYDTVLLHWDFPFYGHRHRRVWINPNGFISFQQTTCGTHSFCNWASDHRELGYYSQYIAPFMADLNPAASDSATVSFWHDDANKRFVLQWMDVPLYQDRQQAATTTAATAADPTFLFSFQVVLHESGDVQFNYKPMNAQQPANPSPAAFNPDPEDTVIANYGGVKYTLHVGMQDDAMFRTTQYVEELRSPYAPLTLAYADLLGAEGTSFRFKALPTCAQQTTCEACSAFAVANTAHPVETTQQCRWCLITNTCSDGEGRELQDLDVQRCTGDNCWVDLASPSTTAANQVCGSLDALRTEKAQQCRASAWTGAMSGDRDRTGPQVNVGGNRSEGGGGGAPSDDLKLWETLAVVCASLLVIVAATWICWTLSNRGGNGGGCCCMNGAKTRRGPGGSQYPSYAMRTDDEEDDEDDELHTLSAPNASEREFDGIATSIAATDEGMEKSIA